MRRFTMFLLATVLALGSMVGQTANFQVQVFGSDDASTRLADLTVTYVNTADQTTYTQTTTFDMRTWMYSGDVFNEIPHGTYDVTVERYGYTTFETQEVIDADGVKSYTIEPLPTADFAFLVTEKGVMIMGELDGAFVSFTDGTSTYEATSDMGYANFADIMYGTYDYTVSLYGYTAVEGTFTVDENTATNGGPIVEMEPLGTADFSFLVTEKGVMIMGELDGATVSFTDGTSTYDGTSDMGYANFSDIMYGTYDYTVSLTGYVTETGTFTVDENTATNGGPVVEMVQEANFMVQVYGSDDASARLDDLTVTYVNTADQSTYSQTTTFDMRTWMYVGDIFTMPHGTYDVTIEKYGYTTYEEEVVIDAGGVKSYTIEPLPTANFSFLVTEKGVMIMGELDGASVSFTDGTSTYEATSDMGYANFADIMYGTYNYTVSLYGYTAVEGTFTVDENTATNGGPIVEMEPLGTADFSFLVTEKGVMIMGELDGATVSFTDGTSTYDGTSDMGYANFSDIMYGTYDYTVSLTGYATVTGTFTVDENTATNGGPVIEMSPVSSFSFLVTEKGVIMMGELDGASVSFTDGTSTYEGTSDMGYANFDNILYGTYDYTVSLYGYVTVTGTFTVDENTVTNGGPVVEMEALATASFSFLVTEKGVIMMGELDGASVSFTDGTSTYEATSDMGYANFTDIMYGTYNYTVSLYGYTTVEGTFTIDENTATNGGPVVEMEPLATESFSFLVTEKGVIMMGELDGASVSFTDGTSTYDGTSDMGYANFTNIMYGTYDYTVSLYGYVTEKGTFTIDENTATNGGPVVEMEPLATEDFSFLVMEKGVIMNGELSGAEVVMTDGTSTYTGTTDMGYANFTAIMYGTYTYTVSLDGYNTVEGTFTVDENTATNGGPVVEMELSTSISKTQTTSVSIYPNPATDVINITSEKEVVSVELIAVNGAKVKQVTRGNITQINISDLAKGIYIVVTTDVNGVKAWTKVNKL